MLKSKVGYSLKEDSYEVGLETAKEATSSLSNVKLNLLYTSCKSDIKKIVKGVKEVNDAPLIGCTTSGGLIVPDGYNSSPL